MTGHPRSDGTWTFYQVQSLYHNDEKNRWSRYTWVDVLDTRVRVESLGLVYEEVTLHPSGKIWQESGIHGTLSLEYAQVLLRLCRRDHPEHAHRVVQMTVSMQTEAVPD